MGLNKVFICWKTILVCASYIYIYKSGEFVCRLWVEITVYLQNGNSDMFHTGFHTGFKWHSTCFVICTKFANQFRLVSSFYGGNKNSNHV